jgi:PIN domain nuclease of toxin-antitoxin system
MPSYLLDTHEWIWFLRGDATRLKASAVEEFLSWQRAEILCVSSASVWEIAVAVSKGRLTLDTSVEDWIARSTVEGGLKLLPLTSSILIESTRLPEYSHKDPVERMIVATAREHNLTLVTRDDKLLQYGAKRHISVLKR